MDRKNIAVAVDENGTLWKGHFGIAPFYRIYNEEKKFIEQRENPYGANSENHSHHDNPKMIIGFLNDCKIFVARRMGQESRIKLKENFGIIPFLTEISLPNEAVESIKLDD